YFVLFFFSSRRRHTRFSRDWSSDVCSSDLNIDVQQSSVSGAADGKLVDFSFCLRDLGFRQLNGLLGHTQIVRPCSRAQLLIFGRSEERRVGKVGRSRWSA